MTETERSTESSSQPPLKSLKVAYALLFLTGLLGIHRLYLKRWVSFALYFFVLWLTLIGFELEALVILVVGLVIDAFLLPRMVDKVNKKIEKDFVEHPERFVQKEEDIAPWAMEKEASFFAKLAAPFRIIQFFFWCISYTILMVMIESDEFIIFLVIILVASGLLTSLDKLVERYPALANIPGIEDALERTIEMRRYYWENEPKLGASVIRMLTRATTEYAPYWKIAGLMSIAILLDTFFSFKSDYAPHLTIEDAVIIIFFQIFIVVQAVLFVLAPISAMSYHYNFSGKKIRLRIITIIALVIVAVGFISSKELAREPGEVEFFSDWRLEERMETPEFQKSLQEITTMYLFYSLYKPSFPSSEYPEFECQPDEDSKTCEPTKQFRKLLAGIAPNTEKEGFEVFDTTYYHSEQEGILRIRGIRKKSGDMIPEVIGIIDEDGYMCERFNTFEAPEDSSEEEKADFEAALSDCVGLINELDERFNPLAVVEQTETY